MEPQILVVSKSNFTFRIYLKKNERLSPRLLIYASVCVLWYENWRKFSTCTGSTNNLAYPSRSLVCVYIDFTDFVYFSSRDFRVEKFPLRTPGRIEKRIVVSRSFYLRFSKRVYSSKQADWRWFIISTAFITTRLLGKTFGWSSPRDASDRFINHTVIVASFARSHSIPNSFLIIPYHPSTLQLIHALVAPG